MPNEIHESDWKVFSALHRVALEEELGQFSPEARERVKLLIEVYR